MSLLLILLGAYGVIGVFFGLYFVTRGVGRLDKAAAKGSIGFRTLVFPGSVAFWPFLYFRLLRAGRGDGLLPKASRTHRRLHLLAWAIVGPLAVIVVVAAWQQRVPTPTQELPPALRDTEQ